MKGYTTAGVVLCELFFVLGEKLPLQDKEIHGKGKNYDYSKWKDQRIPGKHNNSGVSGTGTAEGRLCGSGVK